MYVSKKISVLFLTAALIPAATFLSSFDNPVSYRGGGERDFERGREGVQHPNEYHPGNREYHPEGNMYHGEVGHPYEHSIEHPAAAAEGLKGLNEAEQIPLEEEEALEYAQPPVVEEPQYPESNGSGQGSNDQNTQNNQYQSQ